MYVIKRCAIFVVWYWFIWDKNRNCVYKFKYALFIQFFGFLWRKWNSLFFFNAQSFVTFSKWFFTFSFLQLHSANEKDELTRALMVKLPRAPRWAPRAPIAAVTSLWRHQYSWPNATRYLVINCISAACVLSQETTVDGRICSVSLIVYCVG